MGFQSIGGSNPPLSVVVMSRDMSRMARDIGLVLEGGEPRATWLRPATGSHVISAKSIPHRSDLLEDA
jgi:hypothetical protein